MTYKNDITQQLVSDLYHDENGEPIVLSPGQLEIFDCIAGMLYPRVWVGTYTQYGKSLTVGLATLTRVSHFAERWTIVAPTNAQAQIIMGYIIDHIFDNEVIAKKFEIGPGESAERIRRERSKNKLTFRMADGSIGGVQVLSAQGTRTKDILKAMLGFGSKHVILDESSILPDEHMAGILRMLGGHKENFLMQIGNAIYRNHFYKASKNSRYHKIRVDYRQGLIEGRLTNDFIQEMREEMRPEIFRILYDVKFPEGDAIDAKGYSPLLEGSEVENAQVDDVQLVGEIKASIDVAGGGRNQTVMVVRGSNAGKVVLRTNEKDHTIIIPKVVHYLKKYNVKPKNVSVDATGIGHGFFNMLQKEYGKDVQGILPGSSADNEKLLAPLAPLEFENMRALMYWQAGEWIKKGGKLKRDRGFDEAEDIRYIAHKTKIKMKSKEDMRAEGIESPDTWDALSMTFSTPDETPRKEFKQKAYTPQTPYEGGDAQRPKMSGRVEKSDTRGFGRYAQRGW